MGGDSAGSGADGGTNGHLASAGEARASCRWATLTHAMSNTPITVPNSNHNVVWAPLTSLVSMGVRTIDLNRFSG